MSDAGGRQATGDAARALVHFTPGVPHRLVRFAGHHAGRDRPGIAVHLVGESAHDDLLGFRSRCAGEIRRNVITRLSMFRPCDGTFG
jgi:hypothetical protein